MQRGVRPVPVGPSGDMARITRALLAALDGSGPAVAPVGARSMPDAAAPDAVAPHLPAPAFPPPDAVAHVPEPVALVVATSGSTGRPRRVMLDAAALLASAQATHDRLAGPGRWVLVLPLHHIAGLQVVIRSLVAGTDPAVVGGDRFDPRAAADVIRATHDAGRPRYTSVVPTQLHRLLATASGGVLPAELRPWADLDAILVGGASAAPDLLDRARDVGLRVVTTYGATETAGGCVYDGVPLAGVQVRVDGTIRLAGPVLARGYLDRPDLDAAFEVHDGVRWFRTDDLGEVTGGVLHVVGRADDVIVTGGVKVAPAAVEAALAGAPGVAQVCVVGLPDEEWGQVVTAVVVPVPGTTAPTPADLRDAVVGTLGTAAVPRRLVLVDALVRRGPGKVDRVAVAEQAAAASGRDVAGWDTNGRDATG